MPKGSNDIIAFILISTILILIMGGFIITMLFLYRKKQSKYAKDIEKIKENYEKILLKAQLEIQEETFIAISREIHDNINLSLTLAKLNLNTLFGDLTSPLKESLKEPIKLISVAIDELTDLSRSMNSDIIKECGLITALSLEIERIKKLKAPRIHIELTGNPVFMESQKELLIFRIIQEAFNNILKHAEAMNILIRMHYNNTNLNIHILDDGKGFSKNSLFTKKGVYPSSGFKNIEKRIQLLKGKYKITTEPGRGTHLHLIMPIN